MTTKRWRILLMNNEEIVYSMISFIEQKERELQTGKMGSDSSAKSDIVKSILNELERVTANENK